MFLVNGSTQNFLVIARSIKIQKICVVSLQFLLLDLSAFS